ncbi:MAG TPA: SAF domain-containing protein [Oculatellaceae cyanobacterium]
MEKMRWFIIGNLIGFAILFCGIAVRERMKDSEQSQTATTDTSASSASRSQTGESSESKNDSTSSASEPGSANESEASGLVTTRDITKGTTLHAGDVALRKIDQKHVKANGFTDVESALGRKTKVDLVEGEVLQTVDLEKK